MKKHFKAVIACNAVCLSKSATLWSNNGTCTGWSETELSASAQCFEWTGFCGGSTCISAADEVGYNMAFIKYVSTAGYGNVRIQYDVIPEDFEGKEDDHCYVKYSTNGGGSWITAGDHTTKDVLETDVSQSCNVAADNNALFEVKFETVADGNKCCDYCSWDNMKVIADLIPTAEPTPIPTKTPTKSPTKNPTGNPTNDPSNDPTVYPTADPTNGPSIDPTNDPTTDPTFDPPDDPSIDPAYDPTTNPTSYPTKTPTHRSGEVGGSNQSNDININNTRMQNGELIANKSSISRMLGIVIGVLSFLFCVGIFLYCRYYEKQKKTMELFIANNKHNKADALSIRDTPNVDEEKMNNGMVQILMNNINTNGSYVNGGVRRGTLDVDTADGEGNNNDKVNVFVTKGSNEDSVDNLENNVIDPFDNLENNLPAQEGEGGVNDDDMDIDIDDINQIQVMTPYKDTDINENVNGVNNYPTLQ